MPYPTKKLGDVCEIYQPKTITSNEITEEGAYKVFGANGVIGYYSKYNHKDAEVLVTCRGATCGTLNMSEPKSWITGNAMVIHPQDEKVLSKSFLFYTLKNSNLSRTITGTGQPQITRNSLAPFQIPLPPLATQKQIVERLDKIAEAQKLNNELIQKSDELFQSLLHQELNPAGKNWEEKMVVDIAEARSGFGFPLDLQGDRSEGLPFYKVSDMNLAGNEIEMKSHNNSISVAKGKKLKYKPAPTGSVIFPKIGAAVATNKKRILIRDSLYDNNVMALIPNKLVNPNFLYFWLIKFDISQWASQSMPPSIKKTTVEKYKIPLPPLETQKQIVAKLSAVQEYKTQLLAQKSKLKELFGSVLLKSMSNK